MRSLSATDSTLVIQTPIWIGIACVVLAVALALVAVFLGRYWPPRFAKYQRPARLGAFLATLVLLYVGWHALGTVTTFESRGFYVESIRGEEERVGWTQVSGLEGGGTAGKSPPSDQLTFQLRSGGEVPVDLSGLSADEKAKVVAFVRARMKR